MTTMMRDAWMVLKGLVVSCVCLPRALLVEHYDGLSLCSSLSISVLSLHHSRPTICNFNNKQSVKSRRSQQARQPVALRRRKTKKQKPSRLRRSRRADEERQRRQQRGHRTSKGRLPSKASKQSGAHDTIGTLSSFFSFKPSLVLIVVVLIGRRRPPGGA